MRRRDFIAGLGGVAVIWPNTSPAQTVRKLARIGFLGASTATGYADRIEAFRRGLSELGYIEGTTISIEYRWADDQIQRLPRLADELVRSGVDIIVTHGTPGTLAAKRATNTIPVVIATVGDAVMSGLVASYARPGGNITGQSFHDPELSAKRIELIRELAPTILRVAFLVNAANTANMGPSLRYAQAAAQALNIGLEQFSARTPSEFESVFDHLVQAGIIAIMVSDDAMFISNAKMIAALASARKLISIGNADFADAGGLMGYGTDFLAMFHRAAAFVDKILMGTKPAELPIEQATTFKFVFNQSTAKILGISPPLSILLRIDREVE